jgi:hypothetical protein
MGHNVDGWDDLEACSTPAELRSGNGWPGHLSSLAVRRLILIKVRERAAIKVF